MRGLDVRFAEVQQRGLRGDRRWMLVDQNGGFLTQREKPKMAQIKVKLLREGGLKLTVPNQAPILVGEPESDERISARIWKSSVNAVKAEGEVNEALSSFFEKPVSLVFMDDAAQRLSDEKYTPEPVPVSFADGYPILITSTTSLKALNKHIEAAGGVTSRRSRKFLLC